MLSPGPFLLCSRISRPSRWYLTVLWLEEGEGRGGGAAEVPPIQSTRKVLFFPPLQCRFSRKLGECICQANYLWVIIMETLSHSESTGWDCLCLLGASRQCVSALLLLPWSNGVVLQIALPLVLRLHLEDPSGVDPILPSSVTIQINAQLPVKGFGKQ